MRSTKATAIPSVARTVITFHRRLSRFQRPARAFRKALPLVARYPDHPRTARWSCLFHAEAAAPLNLKTTILRWEPGDTIPVDARRTLQVVRVRDDDADQAPTLVVQDVAERASSADR
jgi:hypothetical protein